MPLTAIAGHCRCHPLSSTHPRTRPAETQPTEAETETDLIITSPKLQRLVRAQLKLCLEHDLPLSILILHISQLETPGLVSHTSPIPQRQRYHASTSQVEQVINQMRRTLRAGDSAIIEDEAGAALFLPGVEKIGAQNILERVYQSLSLLQAKTIIPPLQHETEISIGIGTYPDPGISLDRLLQDTGAIARRIILRPAVYPQDWFQVEPRPETEESHELSGKAKPQPRPEFQLTIPFMQLPGHLPVHLTHLLPYKLANRLKCVPVGYENDNLTVAMANPTSARTLEILHAKTHMHIFPVACNRAELQALLAQGW